ncbi:MAG: type II secretion system protein [Patescibacteria group bacterium]
MKKAFTLIELVVVIALVGVFTGMAVMNYVITNQSKNLASAKTEVLEMIRLARQQTQANQIQPSCTADTFQGYGMAANIGTNTVSLSYFCPAIAGTPLRSLALGTKYGGVAVTAFNSGAAPVANFFFKRLTGVTNTGTDITVCLQQSALSKFSRIVVLSNGSIESYDNQTTCP